MADDGFHSQVKGSSLLLLDNSSDTTAQHVESVLGHVWQKKGVMVNILNFVLLLNLITHICQLLLAFSSLTTVNSVD